MRASPTQNGWLIHAALILANSIFGLGSIVGALGISNDTNPLAFTFVREICSGGILWCLSALFSNSNQKSLPELSNWPRFWKLGFLLFLNQAGYILGIVLAGPVAGSIWQPSAPIITVVISMIGGLEPWNARRVVGVMVAFGGCAAMVVFNNQGDDAPHGRNLNVWIGNGMLLMDCIAAAFYILSSKPVLVNYSALTVTAWSYILASLFMFGAILFAASVPAIGAFICPSCRQQESCLPTTTMPLSALIYYILLQSVAAWGMIIWANQFATATLVVGYSVTQPMSAVLFACLFLASQWVKPCHHNSDGSCLDEPEFGALCGMAGVTVGLVLVVQSEPQDPASTQQEVDDIKKHSFTTADYGSLNANVDI
ncbi:membrane [Seminavis robusta]|uniref:Membrane n=1 Tax=Seminavis robusta TaxID=568900 RepID=A0A9N8DSN6_9STRA|nr:membrane [Seminavis robusta]|eukprot:Sro342_g121820.1 membrane (369) ;mRNA; f:67393-68499